MGTALKHVPYFPRAISGSLARLSNRLALLAELFPQAQNEERVDYQIANAAKHNESGFRMAWEKLLRLPLVSSAAHSH
jgi:hypothetical protein